VSIQLAGLSFSPNHDYNGPASITVHTVETSTSEQLGADAVISVTVTAVDEAPVLTTPSSLTVASVSVAENSLASDVNTDKSDLRVQAPQIASDTLNAFAWLNVGPDARVSGIDSGFDTGPRPTSTAGRFFNTWSNTPDDPWYAGVDFGGSARRGLEESFTGLENFQAGIDRGSVLRVNQADVDTMTEVTKTSSVSVDDSGKTYESIVNVGDSSELQQMAANLGLTPSDLPSKDFFHVASAVVFDPNIISFDDINQTEEFRPSLIARTSEVDEDSKSTGSVDPESVSFIDLRSSDAVNLASTEDSASDENQRIAVASAIDLEKTSFEEIV
jgi:hypothetical protein